MTSKEIDLVMAKGSTIVFGILPSRLSFWGFSFFEPEKALASNDWDVPMNYAVTPQNIHIFKI